MCKFYDSEYMGWHMLPRRILISSQRIFISLQMERFILRNDFLYQNFMKDPKHHCAGDPVHNILKLTKGSLYLKPTDSYVNLI